MRNITLWIYARLKNDSTLRTLLGGSASIPRVYDQYPKKKTKQLLTETSGAFVVFKMGNSPPLSGDNVVHSLAISDEEYYIDVYSIVKSIAQNAWERIDALFNELLNQSMTGYRVQRIQRTSYIENYFEDDEVHQIHSSYYFGTIWKTT